jgi:hypothetical protein
MKTGWSLEGEWLNLGGFMLGLALVGLGNVDSWDAIWAAITPKAVAGFGVATLAYARSINTDKPRESTFTRASDPPRMHRGDPPKED